MQQNETETTTQTSVAPAGFGQIDLGKLPAVPEAAKDSQMLARAESIARAIDLKDQASLLHFGAEPQRKSADMAEQVIGDTRAKDAGPVGDLLNGMLIDLKEIDVGALDGDKGFMEKIPLIGNFFNQAKEFMGKFETVSGKIAKTEGLLQKETATMLGSIRSLESLYGANIDLVRELEAYIEGGRIRLEQASREIPPIFAEATASGDPMRIQAARDLESNARRLEKRVYDLALSRQLAIQTAPQLRMMQHSAAELAEKLQSSVLLTIPLWKQQMAVSIELYRQKKAADTQKKVSDTTNEMLRRNAELLQQGQIAIARESERGIIDIETLRHTQNSLISTIEETARIHEEGRKARKEGLVEIERLENDLKTKLAAMADKRG